MLEELLAWAKTKPADETYTYTSPSDCALAQFIKETKKPHYVIVSPYDWTEYYSDRQRVTHQIPTNLQDRLIFGCCTFGALVTRLMATNEDRWH